MNPAASTHIMDTATEEQVLIDQEPLSPDYLPKELVGRSIGSMHSMVHRALGADRPIHMWLHGPPGTGKTVAARLLSDRLHKKVGLLAGYVNCWENPSLYSVLDRLIKDLRILRAEEQRTAARLEQLQKHLEGERFLLILDEIDMVSPKEMAAILYTFCSRPNFVIIAVARDTRALASAEPRVMSRLNPVAIEFSGYSSRQIRAILEDRAILALKPDSWNSVILSCIAAGTGGDARKGIQALHDAAVAAEQDGSMRILKRHIRKVWHPTKHQKIERRLDSLTEHHRIIYNTVRQNGPADSPTLRRAYVKKCGAKNLKAVAERTYTGYLRKLALVRLVTLKRVSVKGRRHLVSLGQ